MHAERIEARIEIAGMHQQENPGREQQPPTVQQATSPCASNEQEHASTSKQVLAQGAVAASKGANRVHAAQRRDLTFAAPNLERAYKRAHDLGMARVDVVFAIVWLLLAASCMWGVRVQPALSGQADGSGALRDASSAAWVPAMLWMAFSAIPLAGVALGMMAPAWLPTWRERLWAVHRILAVANLCAAHCLFHPHGWACRVAPPQLAALAMLMNALGFKVGVGATSGASCCMCLLECACSAAAPLHGRSRHGGQAGCNVSKPFGVCSRRSC